MLDILQGYHEMQSVNVKKEELLEKLKANREKHIADYKEACKGYVVAVKEALEAGQTAIADRLVVLGAEGVDDLNLHRISFDVLQPKSHEKAYNQVIQMLEMSVDDELNLEADQFACYVMDDWDWKRDFDNASLHYAKNKR